MRAGSPLSIILTREFLIVLEIYLIIVLLLSRFFSFIKFTSIFSYLIFFNLGV